MLTATGRALTRRRVLVLGAMPGLAGLGAGCSTPPRAVRAEPTDAVFDDRLFRPLLPAPDAATLFDRSPAMREYLARRIDAALGNVSAAAAPAAPAPTRTRAATR